jgi:nucleolar MIF4G domain-containing protein 1
VTLADIQTASTRGKWWIVGAAWSGDPVRERERARQAALEAQGSERKTIDRSVLDVLRAEGEEGEDETDLIGLGVGKEEGLLRLARRQGMNTDVRRQVFMVMMTSDVSRLAWRGVARRAAWDVKWRLIDLEGTFRITRMHVTDWPG